MLTTATQAPLQVANTNTNTNERNEQPLEQEWDDLIVAPDDYQINRKTMVIKNKETGISPTINVCKLTGYFQFTIKSTNYKLHRVIALQFVPNPDPNRFTVVDHIDRNKQNNTIANLRWVTQSFNCKNLSSYSNQKYDWLDMLPEDLVQIQRYHRYNFENLFYAQGNFYVQVGNHYRKLEVKTHGSRSGVNAQDDGGKNIWLYLSKIKRAYHLPN
jgi:hypothetical protein